MPRRPYNRIQIVIAGLTLTSEPIYDPDTTATRARTLSLRGENQQALILDHHGGAVASFGWSGTDDDAVPVILLASFGFALDPALAGALQKQDPAFPTRKST